MDTTTTVPAFWRQLSSLYADSVAHAFVLHGNVHDYVPVSPTFYTPLETFILSRLSASDFDIIALVDPAQGLRFPVPAHRDLAQQILGVKPGSPSAVAQLLSPGPKPPMPQRELLHLITQILDQLLTTPWQAVTETEPRPGRVAVLFTYGELLFPDSDLRSSDGPVLARLLQWARSPQVAASRHLLFMVSESLISLHSELRRASSRWEAIRLPLPDTAQRAAFLAHLRNQYDDLVFCDGLDAAGAAAATGALNLLQVEDVAFRALGAGGLDMALITERKAAIISQEFADVLRVEAPRFDLGQVGGYDYLKTFFRQRLISPWRMSGRLPMGGLLLPGPAGTGKTQLAEALAGSAGIPFVVFSPAKILGEYVGNSERNLERALAAVLSLAPCVLFIDEIDQVTGRGEHGGNGVDNRVFARLLSFLEDPARRAAGVLLVAATNRPDLLDDALRSRFDRTAPVLPPTDADRAAIAQTLAAQLDLVPFATEDLADLVDTTAGWVGRNLRDLMAVVAEQAAELPIAEALAEALAIYRPRLRDTQHMTQLALAEISDLRLVPPEYRQAAVEPPAPALSLAPGSRRRDPRGVL